MRHFLTSAAVSLLTTTGCASWFAPKAKLRGHPLESQLQMGRNGGMETFDHSAWDDVVKAVARPDVGRVDYAAVPEAALSDYLDQLATADLSVLPGAEQKALLINAYNALTLSLIVEQPTLPASIRDLDDPWGDARWTVAGEQVSLDDIEHGLLRPIFRDPRLHFALNCASVGCPPLRDEAFTAERVEGQLDSATRDALGRQAWLSVDGDHITVTALLDWYGPDFTAQGWTPNAPSKAAWLARHGPPEVADAVQAGAVLRFAAYDWRLNDVHTPAQ